MIAILCPITSRGCEDSVGRQPIFRALLPSMDALKMWGACTVFLGFDRDDPVWSQQSARKSVSQVVRWIELEGYDRNITAIFNRLAVEAEGFDYMIAGNDDLAFQTSPIDAVEVLKARNNFGTVAFHDDAFPGLPTFYLVGKPHLEMFGKLYPLPWSGAHQDSWIADVYRPWKASEIDCRFRCHNHIGAATRFEYGSTEGYRDAVMSGRKRVRDYRGEQISDDELEAVELCIGDA